MVTALPSMMEDLELPITRLDQASWIVTGYLLGYTVAMPSWGGSPMSMAAPAALSVLIFMAGSALVALSPGLLWLVGARIFQAIGGGALVPVTMAIAGDLFGQRLDRRFSLAVALGVVGAVAEAGGVLGPLYGGLMLNFVSWEWIFWVNLPAGFTIGLLVLLLAPANGILGQGAALPVDYAGGLLIAGSLALLALVLTRQGGESWSPQVMALLAVG